MDNRNQSAFSTATQTAFNTALASIEGILEPIAPNLTPKQREELPKINVVNKAFVEDASNALGIPAAANFIPPYIKKADLDIDLTMFEQIDGFIGRMERALAIARDIRIVAGSEAYTAGLVIKKMADTAAIAGINGAAEISSKLGQRFADNGNRGGNSGDGTTPNP